MSVFSPIDSLLDDDTVLPSSSWIAVAHSCVCNPLNQDWYLPDCTPANCAYTHAAAHGGAPPPVEFLPSKRTYGLLNSGLVVLAPSKALYDAIVDYLHTSPTVAKMALPDQDLLGEVFDAKWNPLSWRFNAIKTFRWVHPELWFAEDDGKRLEGRERRDDGVAVLHYIVEKPVRPPSSFLPLFLCPSCCRAALADARLPSSLHRSQWLDALPPSSPDLETHKWWWADWRSMLGVWEDDERLSRYVEGVRRLAKSEAEL